MMCSQRGQCSSDMDWTKVKVGNGAVTRADGEVNKEDLQRGGQRCLQYYGQNDPAS